MTKRYYWLRLNENFFEREEIKVIESMPNGIRYTNFYLKLLLKSINNEGRLMFRNIIPYTPEMLSSITNTDIDTVRVATNLFEQLGLMEKLDDGALFMAETQNMIGSETDSAKRMREKRERDNKKLLPPSQCDEDVQNSDIEIEIDKEIDKDKDIDKDKEIEVIDKSTSKDVISSSELTSIIEAWNSLSLQKVVNIKNNRLKLLKARIKEYDIDTVLSTIASIKQSTFLRGQNKKGWTINFDWLIKPNNFVKVLEGNYLDKEGVAGGQDSIGDKFDFSKLKPGSGNFEDKEIDF